MKVLSINNNINKQNIMFANNANTTLTANSLNPQPTDSFEREDKKLSKNAKIVIGIGLAVIGATAIYFLTRGRGKVKGNRETSSLTPPKNETPKPIKPENINPNTSSNEDILLRFESYEQRRLNSKPRTEMSVAEREADMEWYREEYYPLLEKIKEQNISTVPKKTFSENSREQVKEKREYIEYVLCRMNDNNASYYDGLLAFEKYGQREPFQDDYYSTLSLIKMNFPENADEKTVNKFMDIYEKFGKGLYLDEKGFLEDGCIDGNNYLTVIGEKGVIKSEEQLQRALEKGKKLIWSNDLIGDLEYNLLKAEDAPFKGNERVEKIIQEFYQTAYNNRTPFKDYPDIKTKEEQFWGISRN